MNQNCKNAEKSQSVPENSVSRTRAFLKPEKLKAMIRCVRALYRLSQNSLYRSFVASVCPESGGFNPGHDAVMMGYDFHLGDQGPQLIEVNTNAGGLLLPWLEKGFGPSLEKYKKRLADTFLEEFSRFSGKNAFPRTLVILDEKPEEKFLYPEMLCFADLFREMGIKTCIVEPCQLDASERGVFYEKNPVDLIYYRHTDFYLKTKEMEGLQKAYLARTICLTPNPYTYALLADKQRLALFSKRDKLEQFEVSPPDIEVLSSTVPECHLMTDVDPTELWSSRQSWVLKPVDKFGSRGVLLGRKISRKRFDEFIPEETLVQRFIPPSLTRTKEGLELKTDFRLFVYKDRVLGILARLFQGQVTNMRTPGGGFAQVHITSESDRG